MDLDSLISKNDSQEFLVLTFTENANTPGGYNKRAYIKYINLKDVASIKVLRTVLKDEDTIKIVMLMKNGAEYTVGTKNVVDRLIDYFNDKTYMFSEDSLKLLKAYNEILNK